MTASLKVVTVLLSLVVPDSSVLLVVSVPPLVSDWVVSLVPVPGSSVVFTSSVSSVSSMLLYLKLWMLLI